MALRDNGGLFVSLWGVLLLATSTPTICAVGSEQCFEPTITLPAALEGKVRVIEDPQGVQLDINYDPLGGICGVPLEDAEKFFDPPSELQEILSLTMGVEVAVGQLSDPSAGPACAALSQVMGIGNFAYVRVGGGMLPGFNTWACGSVDAMLDEDTWLAVQFSDTVYTDDDDSATFMRAECGGLTTSAFRLHREATFYKNMGIAGDVYVHSEMWLVKERNLLVLAFRGTNDIQTALADLEIQKVDCQLDPNGCGKMHRGFHDMTLATASAVYTALQSILNQHAGLRFGITGHSLGGALAQGFALWLCGQGKVECNKLEWVHTFGAPDLCVEDDGGAGCWDRMKALLSHKIRPWINACGDAPDLDPVPTLLRPIGYEGPNPIQLPNEDESASVSNVLCHLVSVYRDSFKANAPVGLPVCDMAAADAPFAVTAGVVGSGMVSNSPRAARGLGNLVDDLNAGSCAAESGGDVSRKLLAGADAAAKKKSRQAKGGSESKAVGSNFRSNMKSTPGAVTAMLPICLAVRPCSASATTGADLGKEITFGVYSEPGIVLIPASPTGGVELTFFGLAMGTAGDLQPPTLDPPLWRDPRTGLPKAPAGMHLWLKGSLGIPIRSPIGGKKSEPIGGIFLEAEFGAYAEINGDPRIGRFLNSLTKCSGADLDALSEEFQGVTAVAFQLFGNVVATVTLDLGKMLNIEAIGEMQIGGVGAFMVEVAGGDSDLLAEGRTFHVDLRGSVLVSIEDILKPLFAPLGKFGEFLSNLLGSIGIEVGAKLMTRLALPGPAIDFGVALSLGLTIELGSVCGPLLWLIEKIDEIVEWVNKIVALIEAFKESLLARIFAPGTDQAAKDQGDQWVQELEDERTQFAALDSFNLPEEKERITQKILAVLNPICDDGIEAEFEFSVGFLENKISRPDTYVAFAFNDAELKLSMDMLPNCANEDGSKLVGDKCLSNLDCDTGNCNLLKWNLEEDPFCIGTCQPKLGNGGLCTASSQCESGQCCGGFCIDRKEPGHLCLLDCACESGVCCAGFCGGQPDGHFCLANCACESGSCGFGRCGAKCSHWNQLLGEEECGADGWCDASDTCQPKWDAGHACLSDVECKSGGCCSGFCGGQPDGHFCAADCACASGQCSFFRCGGQCDSHGDCGADGWCDVSKLCQPKWDPGHACLSNVECKNGNCCSGFCGGQPNGHFCAADCACASGNCYGKPFGTCSQPGCKKYLAGCGNSGECCGNMQCRNCIWPLKCKTCS